MIASDHARSLDMMQFANTRKIEFQPDTCFEVKCFVLSRSWFWAQNGTGLLNNIPKISQNSIHQKVNSVRMIGRSYDGTIFVWDAESFL